MATVKAHYSPVQKALHWIIATMILWQFVSHFIIDSLPETDPLSLPFKASHGFSGIAILLLTLARLVVRVRSGAPSLPDTMNRTLRRIAGFNHALLYVLIVGQTVTGMMAGPGGNKALGPVHGALSFALLIVITLHIAAAIWHLQKGDGIGRRMFHASKT
jgi:cytochrome b561